MLWKKQSYGLTRVVYPDPPSRSEKRDLERHEERCIEDAMEAAELRPCEGYSVPGLATSGREEGLERHEERCMVNEMGRSGATALRGLITSQIPDVEARSGVWNDFGGWSFRLGAALRGGRNGRSGAKYGLTRVVGPDPPSRSEKRGLERHEERRVVEERKEAELQSRAGRLPRSLISEREAESGTTWGALRGGHIGRGGATALPGLFKPSPAISEQEAGIGKHEGRRVVDARERSGATALRGSLYPDSRFRGEKRGLGRHGEFCEWTQWSLRSYGLTRVVYPDPRSRSEERGLERHGEACVVDAMEESELRPFAQTRHLGARSGVWNDMRSTAWLTEWKKAELLPDEGRLFRSPISERERGFGTA